MESRHEQLTENNGWCWIDPDVVEGEWAMKGEEKVFVHSLNKMFATISSSPDSKDDGSQIAVNRDKVISIK